MREKLSCKIVQDLLPGYIDELTSDETNEAVEEHLADCDTCRQMYERMKGDDSDSAIRDKKAINYLKKIKRHNRFDVIFAIVLVITFFTVGVYYQIFHVGRLTTIDDMEFDVIYDESQHAVSAVGTFKNPNRGLGRVVCTETDGIVDATIYSKPATGMQQNWFDWGYFGQDDFRQLSIDGVIVWSDGENINRRTSDIYQKKTEYIGDMSACNAIAKAIGISDQFGAYENEVRTSAQPYDWRLIIQRPLKTEKKEAAGKVMFADACVLLAMIDNLDSVTWDYVIDEGQEVVTISTEDASKYVGKDIKTCGQSARELQHLLIKAGLLLEENSYIETDPMGDVPYGFEMSIENQCDANVDSMRWSYYLDDTFLNGASIGFGPAYHSSHEKITQQIIDTDFLGRCLKDEELSRLTFGLIVGDKDGNEDIVCEQLNLSAKYGETYRYVLTGSFEEGFNLTPKEEK